MPSLRERETRHLVQAHFAVLGLKTSHALELLPRAHTAHLAGGGGDSLSAELTARGDALAATDRREVGTRVRYAASTTSTVQESPARLIEGAPRRASASRLAAQRGNQRRRSRATSSASPLLTRVDDRVAFVLSRAFMHTAATCTREARPLAHHAARAPCQGQRRVVPARRAPAQHSTPHSVPSARVSAREEGISPSSRPPRRRRGLANQRKLVDTHRHVEDLIDGAVRSPPFSCAVPRDRALRGSSRLCYQPQDRAPLALLARFVTTMVHR